MVMIVNIIPNFLSGERNQDSEPSLAVNPANPLQMAASAFTRDPMGGPNAPIYVSDDGGRTWSFNSIVPSEIDTGDISPHFGSTTNNLYAGILRRPGRLQLNVLRTSTFLQPNVMTVLENRSGADQPWTQAATVPIGADAGKDRVYVGNNDLSVDSRTAAIDLSLDAASANPAFDTARIERRATSGQDGPQVRPTIHPDGTIYAAFYGWRSRNVITDLVTADVVVVRDDNWAAGPDPFTALVDGGDNVAGVRVVRGITFPWSNAPTLGQERLGGDLSIAVDPNDSSRVYLAWADQGTAGYTLHVRQSSDRGATWGPDLLTIANAKNPALAISSASEVGLLYQQVTGTGVNQRWETHLRRTVDGRNWNDLLLATTSAAEPQVVNLPYLGDYAYMMAVGDTFYGIFSASNRPDLDNFPNGVSYQRNANFITRRLLARDRMTPVPVSIDPFFFRMP